MSCDQRLLHNLFLRGTGVLYKRFKRPPPVSIKVNDQPLALCLAQTLKVRVTSPTGVDFFLVAMCPFPKVEYPSGEPPGVC